MNNYKNKVLRMGIINVTPDSFTDGGKYFDIESAIKHAKELIESGVDILDIGGESTRPGATPITIEEELKRIIPLIKKLSHSQISIDTYKSEIAEEAIKAGASIINDVSGLTMDSNMVHVATRHNCKIIIMHNTGIPAKKPANSQEPTANSLLEIKTWLERQCSYAIENGVKKENLIIDPGIGFGKTPEEDLYIIKNLSMLTELSYPILIGASKKSFIKKIFPSSNLENKSKEIEELAIKNGATIIRSH